MCLTLGEKHILEISCLITTTAPPPGEHVRVSKILLHTVHHLLLASSNPMWVVIIKAPSRCLRPLVVKGTSDVSYAARELPSPTQWPSGSVSAWPRRWWRLTTSWRQPIPALESSEAWAFGSSTNLSPCYIDLMQFVVRPFRANRTGLIETNPHPNV